MVGYGGSNRYNICIFVTYDDDDDDDFSLFVIYMSHIYK